MSDYQHIDMSYLNDLALGSNDFKIEMIESFTKTTPETIAKMKGCVAGNEWKTIGASAHKLKTSYSFMGMDSMVTLSKQLQDLGLAEENTTEIPNMIQTMANAYSLAEVELLIELNKLKNE